MKEQFIPAFLQAQTKAAQIVDALDTTDNMENPEAYLFDINTSLSEADMSWEWLFGKNKQETVDLHTALNSDWRTEGSGVQTYTVVDGGYSVSGDLVERGGQITINGITYERVETNEGYFVKKVR